MGVPYITLFCCCMELDVGAKFVGYLHLLVSLGLTILCSIFTSEVGSRRGTVEDAGDRLYSRLFAASLSVTVLSVVHMLLALILLRGVYTRRTVYLRVWVWVMSVLVSAALVSVIVFAARGFSATGSEIFIAFAEGVVFFGVVMYCILCVNSYYLKLRSSEDMEGPAGKADF